MMSSDDKLDRKIAEIMRTSIAGDKSAHGRQLCAGRPLLVKQYRGPNRYWRVPVIETARGHSLGYFDISEDPTQPNEFALVRYSLTQPDDVTQMTPAEVVREARAYIGPDAVAEETPILVYLGFPTRIAWKVRMVRPDTTAVDVFVTPGTAFVQP